MDKTGVARDEHADRYARSVLVVVALAAWFAIVAGFDGDGAGKIIALQ